MGIPSGTPFVAAAGASSRISLVFRRFRAGSLSEEADVASFRAAPLTIGWVRDDLVLSMERGAEIRARGEVRPGTGGRSTRCRCFVDRSVDQRKGTGPFLCAAADLGV